MTAGKATKQAVPPAALIAAIIVAIFGPKTGTVSASQVASYAVAVFGALTAVVHAPKVKAAVKKLTPRRKPRAPKPFFMYDTIEPATVPARPQAVAGYVGGLWPTFGELVRRFPRAKHLSIAVNAGEDADCLDIENGDATPAQAPEWCRRQHARGIKRPCVYASVAAMPAVLVALASAGIRRGGVRIWTAHYTGRPHLCNESCWSTLRTIADATQYTDRALERNLDESYCAGSFL